jgi:phosphohistidine phosphatase
MKTLLILRHAKSSQADPSLDDHDRPLNQRGLLDAPRMGQLMLKHNLLPDLVISSTAKRARMTVQEWAKTCGYKKKITYTRDIYGAGAAAYIQCLQSVDQAGQVMVVGHNPDLEELIILLTGRNERMPTAALAQIQLPINSWQELKAATNGKLLAVWRPKELKSNQ